MVTVHREGGFQFRIYINDHEPAHVHVVKGRNTARISIGDDVTRPVILRLYGLRQRDARKARRIVEENQDFLRCEWERIHDD